LTVDHGHQSTINNELNVKQVTNIYQKNDYINV